MDWEIDRGTYKGIFNDLFLKLGCGNRDVYFIIILKLYKIYFFLCMKYFMILKNVHTVTTKVNEVT